MSGIRTSSGKKRKKERQTQTRAGYVRKSSLQMYWKLLILRQGAIDADGRLKGDGGRLLRRQKHSLNFEEDKEKNWVNENAQQKIGHLNARTYGSPYLVICGHYKASICAICKFLLGGASLVNGRVFTANYSSQKLSSVVQSLLFMEAHKL